MVIAAVVLLVIVYMWVAHFVSYTLHKEDILSKDAWDLNICCGKTDVGRVNADIIQHAPLENFCLIEDIYDLPFKDNQFNTVVCSHTMEHVEDPERFLQELKRVGGRVTIIVPPLYDISAAFNPFVHKWLFLTFRKKYVDRLPRYVKLPAAGFIHRYVGRHRNA